MNAALSAATRTVSHIQNELIPQENPPPVDIGAYRAGWQATPTEKGADISNTLPYAGIIEDGARAENIKIGRLMIAALAEWVIRKRIVLAMRGKSKADLMQRAESVAWGIAINMKKRGIFNRDGNQGLHIAEKAKVKAVEYMREEFAAEIQEG